MPKISVIMRTVSKDNFLFNDYGIKSAIQMYIDCFNNQSFKDFEVVFVDYFYEENKYIVNNIKSNFVFKHVPLHPNHSYWANQGYTCGSGFKNTSILYADGQLVVSFDDAEIFPNNLLEMYWEYYSQGLFLHAFHKGTDNPIVKNERIEFPYYKSTYIQDSRNSLTPQILIHKNGGWLYAGSSYALTDLIDLNGFDEKMDGCQRDQDCNMGVRVEGIGRNFVFDKNAFIVILKHKSYKDCDYGDKNIREIIIKDNSGFIDIVRNLKIYTANDHKLSEEEIKIINEATNREKGFSLDFKNENVIKWLNTPNFSLYKERIKLRQSKGWVW
jgi:hypothetical protein